MGHLKILLVLLSIFTMAITSGSAQADIEKQPTHTPAPHPQHTQQDIIAIPATQVPMQSVYTLRAGDVLKVFVFGVADLTGEFKISTSGNITMPLIGEVRAAGSNKSRLEDVITAKLIDGDYFNAPKVTIDVMTLTPFYILGEVKNPGSYPYEPDLDLFKAIAIAGGYTPRAVKEKAVIIRRIGNRKVKINADELTEILPGDSIKVKQRFF